MREGSQWSEPITTSPTSLLRLHNAVDGSRLLLQRRLHVPKDLLLWDGLPAPLQHNGSRSHSPTILCRVPCKLAQVLRRALPTALNPFPCDPSRPTPPCRRTSLSARAGRIMPERARGTLSSSIYLTGSTSLAMAAHRVIFVAAAIAQRGV